MISCFPWVYETGSFPTVLSTTVRSGRAKVYSTVTLDPSAIVADDSAEAAAGTIAAMNRATPTPACIQFRVSCIVFLVVDNSRHFDLKQYGLPSADGSPQCNFSGLKADLVCRRGHRRRRIPLHRRYGPPVRRRRTSVLAAWLRSRSRSGRPFACR